MWKAPLRRGFFFPLSFFGSDQAKIAIRDKMAMRPRGSFFDLLGKC
jgi:hypothetical protein